MEQGEVLLGMEYSAKVMDIIVIHRWSLRAADHRIQIDLMILVHDEQTTNCLHHTNTQTRREAK